MNLYLNGKYLPLEEGRVSVEDRGFQFGDGVYEVVRYYRGRPFRLAQHLRRLEQSVKGVEMPLPEAAEKLAEVCGRVSEGLGDAQVYLQVTRGAAPRTHAFPKQTPPTLVIYARAVPVPDPSRRLRLKSVLDDRWGRCHLKVICLLPNILAKQRAVEAGCDEGLFVREGLVTEGTASNAFFIVKGALLTHPATAHILNGVTREVILELAREAAIPVREEALTLAQAMDSDEAFVTGTITEIGPVVGIDGRPVGEGVPGPLTQRLQTAFRALTARECGT